MDEILDLAGKLGDAMAADERGSKLRQALAAFRADAEAQALQQEYDAKVQDLQQKSMRGEPLEPEDKRAEAELRSRVAGSEVIMEVVKSQADFQQLMHKVQQRIDAAVGLEPPPPEQ